MERTWEADDGQDEDHVTIGREDRCGERCDCIRGVVAAREERVVVEREFEQDLLEFVMTSGIIDRREVRISSTSRRRVAVSSTTP